MNLEKMKQRAEAALELAGKVKKTGLNKARIKLMAASRTTVPQLAQDVIDLADEVRRLEGEVERVKRRNFNIIKNCFVCNLKLREGDIFLGPTGESLCEECDNAHN